MRGNDEAVGDLAMDLLSLRYSTGGRGMKHVLAACFLLLTSAVSALAQSIQAPTLLNFQGRLAKPDGTPVSDGNYSIRFSLWTAKTGGTEKWNQTINPVAVQNGTFGVLLNVANPPDLFDKDLWMEIRIGTASPLTPRQQLVSVAFALKANTVPDGSITSAKISSIDWSKITGAPNSLLQLPYAGTLNSTTPGFKVTNSNTKGSGILGYGQPYGLYGEADSQPLNTAEAYGVYGKETRSAISAIWVEWTSECTGSPTMRRCTV